MHPLRFTPVTIFMMQQMQRFETYKLPQEDMSLLTWDTLMTTVSNCITSSIYHLR